MSRFPTRTLSIAAAAILSVAAATRAQTLDGTVVQDPRSGTATYTIDLDGPPRGSALLFASYGLLPAPVPLPMGPLFLDPTFLVPLPGIGLDANGKGQFKMSVPSRLVNGDNIYFQALFNDGGVLRFSSNYCSTLFGEQPVDDSLTTVLWHNSKTQNYKGEFRGRAGAAVEIVHYRGGQIDIWQGIIPANGRLPVNFCYKNKLKHNDVIEIRYKGKPVKSWKR